MLSAIRLSPTDNVLVLTRSFEASETIEPTTKNKWWPITDAYQIRLPGTPKGSQWLGMEQVMHLD
jgi:hypothetical protein